MFKSNAYRTLCLQDNSKYQTVLKLSLTRFVTANKRAISVEVIRDYDNMVITFHVSRKRREMYSGHSRL